MAEAPYILDRSEDAMRRTLERIVTDGVWRCPNRAVAGTWAKAGGDVWVGEWTEGETYPTNQGTYCQAKGRVCHEVSHILGLRVNGRMIYCLRLRKTMVDW